MAISQYELDYKTRETNAVDGFAYNTAVLPNAYGYHYLCIDSMVAIRNANNYKPKLFAMPDQSVFGAGGITPFTSYVSQVRMVPGTHVLGFTLAVLNFFEAGVTADAFQVQNNFYVSLTDDATGVPFFSDYLTEILFGVNTLLQPGDVDTFVPKTMWFPLTRPRAILLPGIVTMMFCYKGPLAEPLNIAPQVILVCAEPCVVPSNSQECQ